MSKRTIIITSPAGVHVPAWGRLGPGTHKDIDLDAEQFAAIEAQGGEVLTAAAFAKRNKNKQTPEV